MEFSLILAQEPSNQLCEKIRKIKSKLLITQNPYLTFFTFSSRHLARKEINNTN